MSAIVSIDSSSDEEIQFFPVTKPKQDNSDDDEVIFCGANITPKRDNKCKPISYLKGRDVTIQSVGKKKSSSNSNSDHDDVEFLGYVPKDDNKPCSVTKVRKNPRSRSQSNVNININSEKSTSNLISIDIEDADSNQKKVKLTFLGPSRRQTYTSVSNILNTSTFHPKSISSPKKLNNNLSNAPKNQRSIAPRALTMGDTSSRISQKSNVIINQQTKSQLNSADGKRNFGTLPPAKTLQQSKSQPYSADNKRNFGTLSPAKTVIHNFRIPKIGEKNISNSQTGCKVNSQGQVLNKAVLNDSSQLELNKLNRNLNKFIQNSITSKSSNLTCKSSNSTSKGPNSPVKENKIVTKNKTNNATEKSIKNPESSRLNNSNLTVENQNKTIECAKATRSDEMVSPESESSSDKNTNIKKKKLSPTTIESKTDKVARKEPAVRPKSPEPSTSGIGSKQAHQSSESESEDSRYDSSSDMEENKPSMKKPELDKLFNQFLDHCSKNYSKKDVSVLTSKLRKLYKKTTKVEENEDFIITLKEANLKVENKSIRCPLNRMKQVQAQLRKNSPDNIHNIKRLENVLEKINEKIKKLEEAEVTSDEEECNNNYITLERYQKRAVKIYEKICELSSLPADAERATLRNVSFQGSAPGEFSKSKSIQGLVNKVSHALEKYYNKSRKFPDFNDVNILMNKLSVELSIKIKPTTLTQLAKSIFVEFGNMLQRRRLHDDYRICMEYLESDEEDPYHYDPILAAKLDENRKTRRKEQHVLDKFCLKQIALKEKDYQDNSESSSSNDSETDRRRKKSKKRRDKSENEDSDSSENFNVKQNRTGDNCDDSNDSSNDSGYTKKKSSKTNRKRTRTSSESSSDSSSSSTKRDRDKRHKSKKKKNKLVRDKSLDKYKPEKECLGRARDSKLPCNESISENDARLTASESVKETDITENQRALCETELIEDENVGEMGTTETENVNEVEKIENERVKEVETFEIESDKEMETIENECVKEMETIENECDKEVETIEIESDKEMETIENECVKEMETIENECVKEMETIENECDKEVETLENESDKEMETNENVREMGTNEDESVKEIETVENVSVKETNTIEDENVKPTDTVEDDSVKEMETIENESDKEIETTINETHTENNEGSESNVTYQEGDHLENDDGNHFESADTNTADGVTGLTENNEENDDGNQFESADTNTADGVTEETENNEENDDGNQFESADTNTADGVTEETENNEENDAEDEGNLSIQIVNVKTCSQPFSMSQDEDTCESESKENKVQLAVTEITDTIELSDDDDDDCVVVCEEKKSVLTEQEVMELIPLIFDRKLK